MKLNKKIMLESTAKVFIDELQPHFDEKLKYEISEIGTIFIEYQDKVGVIMALREDGTFFVECGQDTVFKESGNSLNEIEILKPKDKILILAEEYLEQLQPWFDGELKIVEDGDDWYDIRDCNDRLVMALSRNVSCRGHKTFVGLGGRCVDGLYIVYGDDKIVINEKPKTDIERFLDGEKMTFTCNTDGDGSIDFRYRGHEVRIDVTELNNTSSVYLNREDIKTLSKLLEGVSHETI